MSKKIELCISITMSELKSSGMIVSQLTLVTKLLDKIIEVNNKRVYNIHKNSFIININYDDSSKEYTISITSDKDSGMVLTRGVKKNYTAKMKSSTFTYSKAYLLIMTLVEIMEKY